MTQVKTAKSAKKVAKTKATAKRTTRKSTAKATKSTKTTAKKSASRKTASAKTTRKKPSAKKTVGNKTSTKKTAGPNSKVTAKATPQKTKRAPSSSKKTKKTSAKPSNTPPPPNSEETSNPDLQNDFELMSEYMTEISKKSHDVFHALLKQNPDLKTVTNEFSSDPLNIGSAFQELLKGLSQDPGTVMQRQFNLWGNYAKMMSTMSQRMAGETVKPAAVPQPWDKRFNHPAWEENPMLDYVKQSYLILSDWLTSTVDQLEGLDEHEHHKAKFYTRQFTDAFSPSNFAALNPEVVETTVATKGENLLKGLHNLLEDLDRGQGKLSIRQADTDYFKLGENVATTPGKVVFQNEIFQLIQYQPTTDKVAKRPLLIFPPWINKFYILDLQPQNSFIKWMVDQGRTVFIVSWVNPGSDLREKTFFDYIQDGAYAALDAIELATGEKEVDAIGYCIGGTMLSTALSHMAQTGDNRIKSATFFTAQADFSEAGDLLLFVDDTQLDALAKQMDAAGGVLEGSAMASTFNMLRSNDLIWSFFVDNYLKGKDPAKFDLLFWNSDATRMPKEVHLFYLREFYQHNRLAKGEMSMDGIPLELDKVNIPIFMQAGETDHIAPYRSIYNTARKFGGEVQYMLAGSGHIAGVVNHPSKNKYHHSINSELPETVEQWMGDAKKYPGSWWPHWMTWLDQVSPNKVKARTPGSGKLKIIEDAPGSYVREKA